ncbi:MAG: hypothetical protein IKU25_05530 [Clostridia bacterium]|nr:hypothetical protein [Clostridia bacterium]
MEKFIFGEDFMRIRWNKLGLSDRETKDILGARTRCKNTVTSVYFCPECGTEIYGEWKYTLYYAPQNEADIATKKAVNNSVAEFQKLQKEAEAFAELEKCPICNGQLIHDNGYFIQNDLSIDESQFFTNPICRNSMKPAGSRAIFLRGLEEISSFLSNARSGIAEKKATVSLLELNNRCDIPVDVAVNPDATTNIKTDSKKLQEYLLKIINIEKNIRSIKQRLFFLFLSSYVVNQEARFAQSYPLMVEKQKASEKIDELQMALQRRTSEIVELQERRDRLHASSVISPSVTMPVKPTAPVEPVYATANLFNKKKIAVENETKSAKYNAEVALYNKALSEYPMLLEQAKKQQEELREKAIQERNIEILELDTIIKEKNLALEKLRNEIEAHQIAIESNISQLQNNTDYAAVQLKTNLDKEIEAASELLAKLFKQKNQLYATEVIFGKYRDLTAVTSFYEYLLSGRCEALDGVNGCYNLYESELRANIIINKLEAIGDSLEQIKGNQYMLYSQLSQINTELNSLNSTTTAMLNGIRDTAEIFLEHSTVVAHNSAIIAYNSAVSAYYSKLNAEIASSDRYISIICW